MAHTSQSPIPVTPSDVACIELVNSVFTDYLGSGERTERIASAGWQKWFLDRYELRPDAGDEPPIDELVALRRDLRRILEKWSSERALSPRDVRALDARVSAAPVRQRVAGTGGAPDLVHEPLRRDWTWVMAMIATSAVELMRSGDPKRMKTCANSGCSWMFYDTSVNRSRRFCTATPCGSLTRVRRFRHSG